jgi:hypothetical protein
MSPLKGPHSNYLLVVLVIAVPRRSHQRIGTLERHAWDSVLCIKLLLCHHAEDIAGIAGIAFSF